MELVDVVIGILFAVGSLVLRTLYVNVKEIRIPRNITFLEKKLLIELVMLLLQVFSNVINPMNKGKRLQWIIDVTNFLETYKKDK